MNSTPTGTGFPYWDVRMLGLQCDAVPFIFQLFNLPYGVFSLYVPLPSKHQQQYSLKYNIWGGGGIYTWLGSCKEH